MKKINSITCLLFLSGMLFSCNSSSDDQAATDNPVQVSETDISKGKEIVPKDRFTIARNQFGELEVGKFTFQDAKAIYPELTVDTIEALEHQLEHFLSRKSYWFSKGNQVSFILILGIDQATGDTVDAIEIRSPEFTTQTGIKTGMTAKELLKINPGIKISQGEIEYENCEIANDPKEGITYYFKTEWGKRIGRYQYEEDSETNSDLVNNLDARIDQIYLFRPQDLDTDLPR